MFRSWNKQEEDITNYLFKRSFGNLRNGKKKEKKVNFKNTNNFEDLLLKIFSMEDTVRVKVIFNGNLAFREFAKAKLESLLRSKCQDL